MSRRISEIYGSGKYMKAADVSSPLKLTVDSLTDDEMPDGEIKTCVHFKEIDKPLVLNKTNAQTICDIASAAANTMIDDLDDCLAIVVVAFESHTDFQGRTVPCVRLRAPKDKSNTDWGKQYVANHDDKALQAEAAQAQQEDDIPF